MWLHQSEFKYFFFISAAFSTEGNIFICAKYQLTHLSVPSLMCVSTSTIYRVKKGVGVFQCPFKNGNIFYVIRYFFPAVSKEYHS